MRTVLHVTDCYLPRVGGIELHVRDLVRVQRQAGIDAQVLTPTGAGLESDPPWVHRFGRPWPVAGAALSLAALRARLLVSESPVVHIHVSVWSPLATLAAQQSVAAGLPTLVTIHSIWNRLGILPAAAQALLRLRAWPVQWSAVSQRAAEPIRQMLGGGVEVAVLPNAVDAADWRVEPHPNAVPTIVSVTRFTRTKRPIPLVRMLAQVRDRLPTQQPLRAVVIGDGHLRGRSRDLLSIRGMDSWVALPGRLDRAEIRDELARAALYVAPAELESFGIAALEARCAGLPVVASGLSGVGEFITSGIDGLMADSDPGLVDAMVRLLTDHDLRNRIAAHNRQVTPAFGWAAARVRADALYDEAVRVAERASRAGGRRALVPAP